MEIVNTLGLVRGGAKLLAVADPALGRGILAAVRRSLRPQDDCHPGLPGFGLLRDLGEGERERRVRGERKRNRETRGYEPFALHAAIHKAVLGFWEADPALGRGVVAAVRGPLRPQDDCHPGLLPQPSPINPIPKPSNPKPQSQIPNP